MTLNAVITNDNTLPILCRAVDPRAESFRKYDYLDTLENIAKDTYVWYVQTEVLSSENYHHQEYLYLKQG